ncbi:MAG: MMPL family transporter, partial [Thermomicrobiales bacterium]|nr:MMPL family transporter [Thermomicrobiales bacterium]
MASTYSNGDRKVPTSSGKPGLLRRWIDTVTAHPKRVLLVFFVLLAVLVGIATSVRGQFVDSFSLPGAESQRAYDLLAERFPGASGISAQIVFQVDESGNFQDPAVQEQIEALLAEIGELPHVASTVSPYDAPYQVSQDGTIAYATVNYDVQFDELSIPEAEELVEVADAASTDQLRVVAGGDVVSITEQEFGNTAEFVGILAAAIILLIAFGSVVAMGLPIATALIGLTMGFMGIFIATRWLDIATFAPQFASMIGIGVGIDYALFIVTRYREGIKDGLTPKEATGRALDTAGRAVIFAGSVVVISMLGLSAVGIKFVAALGVAAAIVVATAVLVAFTVLPALLTLVGTRIDKWSIHLPGSKDRAQGEPFGRKLSRRIQGRPWLYAIASTAFLLVLAIPTASMDLGFPDAGANPSSYHTRQAYDLLTDGFGEGFNNPLLLVLENENGVAPETVESVTNAVSEVPGVVQVAQPFANEAGDTTVITVIPTGNSNSDDVSDLVKELRNTTLPAAVGDSGTTTYVGGGTASFLDFSEKMVERTPWVFAVIIGLSFILLTIVFRSPVIALKAAIMNMLSIAAAFGVIVAVFQFGWGHQIFGIEETQPIAVFLPIFLFAILFGLSMDYEVFLLSRIREFWAHGRSTSDAVADGLTVTARVITAAAAIMICVFLAFVMNPIPIVKQMGFGLAVAILIDATIVRLVLVPSTMELLDERNWWFPKWLDRITPHVNIEGKSEPSPHEFDPLPGTA